jgi:hypothetical protein
MGPEQKKLLMLSDIICLMRNHKQAPKQTINQVEKPQSIASYKVGGCIYAVNK